ncbi:unnamed protein product [Gadus morhua 'NCC']
MGQCLFPLLASKDMGAIDAAVLQLEDCPDLDIVEIFSLVIVRRERQMVQLQKGLKDTRVLEMLKERPELASALFPRSAELEPEMIIERIVWPEPDSDEEEEIDDYCSVVAYLRQ